MLVQDSEGQPRQEQHHRKGLMAKELAEDENAYRIHCQEVKLYEDSFLNRERRKKKTKTLGEGDDACEVAGRPLFGSRWLLSFAHVSVPRKAAERTVAQGLPRRSPRKTGNVRGERARFTSHVPIARSFFLTHERRASQTLRPPNETRRGSGERITFSVVRRGGNVLSPMAEEEARPRSQEGAMPSHSKRPLRGQAKGNVSIFHGDSREPLPATPYPAVPSSAQPCPAQPHPRERERAERERKSRESREREQRES